MKVDIAKNPPFDDTTKIGLAGTPGVGFDLTSTGNYDINNKILKNCRNPLDDQDICPKRFVLDKLEKNFQSFKEIIVSNKNNIFLNFVKGKALKIQNFG